MSPAIRFATTAISLCTAAPGSRRCLAAISRCSHRAVAVFGIEGAAPPSTAGIITRGSGDIQLYSQGSILLGQSRIMTTFGGSILGWSAEGDINAGRGSKTTVVYTPPKRVYDIWGNVTLSPSVPSTGAGIATLNPIAEVAPGNIDLIAPLGTIDAGEAGIRVSGNVNIAALTVVNAANISVQGKATGVPVVSAVNTGAITSASSAASSATQAAEDVARQQQAAARQNQPRCSPCRYLASATSNWHQRAMVPVARRRRVITRTARCRCSAPGWMNRRSSS